MKRHLLILAYIVFSSLAVIAQNDIVSKCENIKGVTTISISKPMLKMAGPRIGNKDISAIASKMDHIDIITAGNRRAALDIQKIIDATPEIANSEKLIHINDNGEKVTIKYRPDKSTTSYYMFTKSDGNYTLIIFTGTMTVDDILSVAHDK